MGTWEIIFWVNLATLLYVQVVYAGLMAICGRFFNARHSEPAQLPTVTLVIAAYNEELVIEDKLQNALQLDYPREKLEVTVGVDCASDRTADIARRFEQHGITVHDYPERRGKPSVVNDLIESASGDVVFLCDANVMFRPDALKRLIARLVTPDIGMVTGDVRLSSADSSFGEGESTYYGLERLVQLGESSVGSVMGVDGGMYIQRRECFRPLPPNALNEEFYNTMATIRQGKRVVYEPTAIATECGTPLARVEFRRRIRVAAGAVQSLKWRVWPPWWHPIELWQFISHKLLRWLGPVWLMLLLISNSALWNAGRVYQMALLGQLGFYAIAVIATFSLRIRQTRIGGIVFYFVMSHVGMGLGLMKGLLNLQPVTWNRTDRSTAVRQSNANVVS